MITKYILLIFFYCCVVYCQQHPFTTAYELRFWKLTHDDHSNLVFDREVADDTTDLNFSVTYDTINPLYEIPYSNTLHKTIDIIPDRINRPDTTLWDGDTLRLNCSSIYLEAGDYAITAHDVWEGSFTIDTTYYPDTTLYGGCTSAYYIRVLSPTLIENINIVNSIKTELYSSSPNPFNNSTAISFSLEKYMHVKISVYNTLGQEISVIVNKKMNRGQHKVYFRPGNIATGMYIYVMRAGNFIETKRMIYLK